MADELLAEAGWAVWSKDPGTREDYSVLACSDTFTRTDFAKIISRYTAGTPDTRVVQGLGALPWVTVSWVGVDDAVRVGLAITDQTDQVDGVGRPITRTRYFCVPYHVLSRDAVSYTALYRGASQVTQFPSDGQPVQLAVPRVTAPDVLASVLDASKVDYEVLGCAAALLLDGPVSVVHADGSTVTDRLAFIDAVASLLPYGFRAKFTAGTWADSGIRHRLRLAFATRPREDAAAVSLRHGGRPPTGAGSGLQYFEQFRQLSGGTAAAGPFSGRLVADAMAAESEPQRFEQPDPAVAALREIDLPWRVRRAIRDKAPVDLAELRRVFATGRLTQLEPPRTDLLEELSVLGEAKDWPHLVRWLGEAAGDRNAAGLVLAQFGGRVLWHSQPVGDVVRKCLTVADTYEAKDNVLASLVRTPVPIAGYEEGVRILADMVEGAVLGGADQAAYPYTRDQLTRNPVAAAEVMAALAASNAAELLNWLSPQLPEPLARVFEFALEGRRGKVTEADFSALSQLGDDCVRAALRVASGTGRLASLLPSFTGWLAARWLPGGPDQRSWERSLQALAPAGAEQRAYVDTALLIVGASPVALPPPAGHPDWPAYAEHLAATWRRLAKASGQFSPESCVQVLARYLDGQRWTDTKQQARGVVELGSQLVSYDPDHVLVGTLASRLDANPRARGWDFAQQLLEWVQKNDPDAVRKGLLARLDGLPAGASPEEAAELCRRASEEGIKPQDACERLAKSGAIDSPEMAAALLTGLRPAFAAAVVQPKVIADWQRKLAAAIARGQFSGSYSEFPREVRKLVSDEARQEMRQQFELLSTLIKAIRDAQYELTDEERDDLADLGGAIEVFVRKARKRGSLWRNVWPAWGDDETRQAPRQDVGREGRERSEDGENGEIW
jgi:hypothetical protein